MRLFVMTMHNSLLYCSPRLGYFQAPLDSRHSVLFQSRVLRNQYPIGNVKEALISTGRELSASQLLIPYKGEKHDIGLSLHLSSSRFRFTNLFVGTKGCRFEPLYLSI